MSVVEPGGVANGLVQRVINLLMRPSATWETIEAESASIGGLYRGYVIPLAGLAAVCSLIGGLVFGHGALGFTVRFPIVWEIANAVGYFVLNLVMIYVLALVIDGLAPNFGGAKDQTQAFKVAAYASTPGWVAGVFGLLPALAVLTIIGAIYGLVLLYKGLPRLMKTPQERTTAYFVTILVVAVVLNIIVAVVLGSITNLGRMALPAGPVAGGTITTPAGSVDLGKLEEMSKRAEAAAKQMESGQGLPATDPEVLKGYLPASVGGFTRDEVSASSGGAGGMQGSQAEARYQKGEASLRLEITDLGAAGALAGMASAFKVKSSKETSTGYEKVDTIGGRMTTESYDRASKHGEYGVLVGERFMVQASGDGLTMDDLKAAVNAVGLPRLEGLAKAG